MYKALFELSADRADFLSRLFSRPRPPGLRPEMTPTELFRAFAGQAPSETLFTQNLSALQRRLVTGHGFPLSADDDAQLELIYSAFLNDGPDLRYSAAPTFALNGSNRAGGGYSGFAFQYPDFPSYQELQEAADAEGLNRGYLATEANFQFLKAVPKPTTCSCRSSATSAGLKALRAIGGVHPRAHGATVSGLLCLECRAAPDGRRRL